MKLKFFPELRTCCCGGGAITPEEEAKSFAARPQYITAESVRASGGRGGLSVASSFHRSDRRQSSKPWKPSLTAIREDIIIDANRDERTVRSETKPSTKHKSSSQIGLGREYYRRSSQAWALPGEFSAMSFFF